MKSWGFWRWGRAKPAGSGCAAPDRGMDDECQVFSPFFGGWLGAFYVRLLFTLPIPGLPKHFFNELQCRLSRCWRLFSDLPHREDIYTQEL